jgi:glucokinase
MSRSGPILAIDVGGTKLAAGLVHADGRLQRRLEVATSPVESGQAEALWSTLVGLVDEVCDGEMPAGVGVGCGGPLRWPDGVVSPLNIPAWRDFPLRSMIAGRFPGVPVRLANDAMAMAIGEHWRGAGVGARALLGIVVSTGVGGGLIVDDGVLLGPTGNAGHLGHVVVEPAGPDCACGGRGCLEAIARGPAVVKWAQANGWTPPAGAAPSGLSLLADALAGDSVATAAFARAGEALGVAIASAVHLLELDVVVVGGGLSAAGELLLAPARVAFRRHARMEFAARCRIAESSLGPDAGLVGAAALVACGDRYWPSGAD